MGDYGMVRILRKEPVECSPLSSVLVQEILVPGEAPVTAE